MFGWLSDPHAWAALMALTAMEIVLGIDNVVFISVLVARLKRNEARRARQIGLALALIFRILLLFFLSWLIGLSQPVITATSFALSWRDIVLVAGGLFLIAKATREIHTEIEGEEHLRLSPSAHAFLWVIAQVTVIDIIFSVDSIITAIGMAEDIEIMVLAILFAVLVMYFAAGVVGQFIADYPTTKMLALAFLLLIGVALVADGMSFHIPRGYIYFAMAFAAGVEFVNVLARRRRARYVPHSKAATGRKTRREK